MTLDLNGATGRTATARCGGAVAMKSDLGVRRAPNKKPRDLSALGSEFHFN